MLTRLQIAFQSRFSNKRPKTERKHRSIRKTLADNCLMLQNIFSGNGHSLTIKLTGNNKQTLTVNDFYDLVIETTQLNFHIRVHISNAVKIKLHYSFVGLSRGADETD